MTASQPPPGRDGDGHMYTPFRKAVTALHSANGDLAVGMSRSVVYTLHLWPPLGHAGHYTGSAIERRLAQRLTDHALGRGARLGLCLSFWGAPAFDQRVNHRIDLGVRFGRQLRLLTRRVGRLGRGCIARLGGGCLRGLRKAEDLQQD